MASAMQVSTNTYRPLNSPRYKDLIPPDEWGVMTIEIDGIIHLSTSKIKVGKHIVRPASEVTCKDCRDELKRRGVI